MITERVWAARPRAVLSFVALCAGLLWAAPASAEDRGLDLARKQVRGSAIIQDWGFNSQRGCKTVSLLGLCGSEQVYRENRTKRTGLISNGWHNLKALKVDVAKMTAKSAPNKLFQLVKLFIDDMQVAEIGDMRVKVSIEIQ